MTPVNPVPTTSRHVNTDSQAGKGVTLVSLTRFEITRILGARALQIAMGSPVLVEVSEDDDPLEIAKREYLEGRIPVVVKR